MKKDTRRLLEAYQATIRKQFKKLHEVWKPQIVWDGIDNLLRSVESLEILGGLHDRFLQSRAEVAEVWLSAAKEHTLDYTYTSWREEHEARSELHDLSSLLGRIRCAIKGKEGCHTR